MSIKELKYAQVVCHSAFPIITKESFRQRDANSFHPTPATSVELSVIMSLSTRVVAGLAAVFSLVLQVSALPAAGDINVQGLFLPNVIASQCFFNYNQTNAAGQSDGNGPFLFTLSIRQKITAETGGPCKGIRDNLKPCHFNGGSVLNTSPFDAGSYDLRFTASDGGSDRQCMNAAIQAAEQQSVYCTVPGFFSDPPGSPPE